MDSTTTQVMTADELFRMPNDGAGYELVRGELRRKGDPHKMSPTGFRHGTIVARLTVALGKYAEANQLGEVTGAESGFKLTSDPDTVRAPDIGFVRRERIPVGNLTEKFWPGAPDLAVEVISPNDRQSEVDENVADYLAAGVRLIWIVNPKTRTVTVHRPDFESQTLNENDVLGGMDVLPDFQYNITGLFASKR